MNLTCISGSLLVATLLASSTQAQIITWGTVADSIGPTDVSLNGTLVVAENLHGGNATVNGVPFTGPFNPTDWNGYITGGLNGSTTGDPGYDVLLSTSRANAAPTAPPTGNPSAWGAIRIDNLAPLSPGALYEIQVWFTDQRTGSGTAALYDRVMTLSSAWGAAVLVGGEITNIGSMLQGPLSGPLEADPDNAPALTSPDLLFGSHCIGTFTYIPVDETYLMVQGSHPNAANLLRPHVTAFQIRDLSGPTWSAYGSGCAAPGSLPMALQLVSLPAIGGTFALDVTNVGSGIVFMALGLAQANTPLTLPMLPAGCTQLTQVYGVQLLPVGGGVASWSLALPNYPSLAGLQIFTQAAEFDAPLVTLSDGGVGTIR